MRNIKKIFIVVFSLILLFAVSCSNDDKTGISNNPPENDTEITDGETGSGSSSGGSSEPGTGGGSEEGGGGTETPPTPSKPETTEEGYFPPPEGGYRYDSRMQNYTGSSFEPKVYYAGEKTKIEGTLILHGSDGGEDGKYRGGFSELTVSKWKKTTKNGEITKTEAVEIEGKILIVGIYETLTFSEVIYDYETKTLSITCKVTKDGINKIFSTKSKKY